MQALSEKGTALLAKFKKFQKLSLVLYALAGNGICICRKYSVDDYYCGAGYLPGNKVV